jgi:hypothetical protein
VTIPLHTLLMAAGGAGGLQLPSAILSFSPLSYFDLRESVGPFNDQGSLANDATAAAGWSLADRAGTDGFSYPTSGVGDGGSTAPDNDGYTPSLNSGLTVGGLVYLDAITTQAFMAKYEASGTREWQITIGQSVDGDLFAAITASNGTAARQRLSNAAVFTTATWYLIIVRFSSSTTTAPTYRVNGAAPASTASGSGTATGSQSSVLRLGARNGATPLLGTMAHSFVIPGELSDGDCGVIEAAAQADGWF